MDPAYYVAAGSLKARSAQLEVLANNLANVSTAGFKPERTFFTVFNKARQATGKPSFTKPVNDGTALAGRGLDMRQGALQATGAPLDLALEGQGFFAVQGSGGVELTRDGRFSLGAKGQIQTSDGRSLLGKNSQLLTVNPSGGPILIAPDGTLSQAGTFLGQLDLRAVADPSSLRPLGAGRFEAPSATTVPSQAAVRQGFVEQSGVEVATAMVEMIRLNRLFEMSLKVASALSNDLDSRSINDIAMQR